MHLRISSSKVFWMYHKTFKTFTWQNLSTPYFSFFFFFFCFTWQDLSTSHFLSFFFPSFLCWSVPSIPLVTHSQEHKIYPRIYFQSPDLSRQYVSSLSLLVNNPQLFTLVDKVFLEVIEIDRLLSKLMFAVLIMCLDQYFSVL